MRMTNTKPWWKEFDRRVTCIAQTFITTATIISPGQPKKAMVYCFLDWDTRQDYYVVLPYDFGDGMGDYELENRVRDAFKVYWNLLSPGVRIIALDENQRLQAASPNPAELIGFPENGVNTLVSYFAWPRLEDVKELCHLQTINRSHLVEIDRLAPRVDVMEDKNRNGQRIVTKWLLGEARHTWREMLTLKSIPLHPHIVPIDCIILDDERIVGWASKHVDGSDLEIDKSQFKMKWLMQLTQTLDYLHLELGILHGDLQLKNMLVDKTADKVLLVDFESAIKVNESQLQWEFNQLTWSVYEIVTHDSALVEDRLYDITPDDENPDAFYDRDPSVINEMSEWPVRTNLDCESEEIRQHLQSWIQRRKALPITTSVTQTQWAGSDIIRDLTGRRFRSAIVREDYSKPLIQALVTTSKTSIQISVGKLPEPSSAIKQNRLLRKARFEEIQKRQREQQEEKESLVIGEVRWERPPYATAHPGRAEKANNPTVSERSESRKRSAAPDPQGSGQEGEQGKLLADIEEGEPLRKRAKVSDTTVTHGEDVVCHMQHVESETVESPISPKISTILDTAKISDES
ncbi:hypothetical protein F5B21DRAFT_523284 [Xylaria acuta]|nr:hypothetical protein F5B21DRAFT_523284 [Xylaria acuta]